MEKKKQLRETEDGKPNFTSLFHFVSLSGHTCSYGLLATFFFEELSSFQVPTSYQIQQWRLAGEALLCKFSSPDSVKKVTWLGVYRWLFFLWCRLSWVSLRAPRLIHTAPPRVFSCAYAWRVRYPRELLAMKIESETLDRKRFWSRPSGQILRVGLGIFYSSFNLHLIHKRIIEKEKKEDIQRTLMQHGSM